MNNKKLFVVRKYIMAKDAVEAIKIDKITKPDDIYIDSDWKEKNMTIDMGFKHDGK
jgi:hypothetical protein